MRGVCRDASTIPINIKDRLLTRLRSWELGIWELGLKRQRQQSVSASIVRVLSSGFKKKSPRKIRSDFLVVLLSCSLVDLLSNNNALY